MRQLQPVIWMKGTFLSPQYLQTQDRYLESSLRFQTEALCFRPWGFGRVEIDREQLAGGNFAISSASGIFPDGLLFDIPASDAAPRPRPIADAFEVDQESMDVFLAIPHQRIPGLNVALTASPKSAGADTRYLADYLSMRDENTGQTEKPVQLVRKNFRILVEGESREGASCLRVARVRRTPAGLLELDPHFVPPLIDLGASDFLVAIARRLVEILAAKSSMLSGSRRQKNLSLAEFGTADIASFWLLYTINSHFPLLQHVLETRRGHPEEFYAAMLSLAGCLSTFSPTVHPRDLPQYDHDNLGRAFADLDDMVRMLLDTVVPSNFVSLALKLLEPSIYGTSLSDDKYLRNTRLYLSMSAEMNEGELIAKAPYLVKVCSANHIQHLVRQALPGVPLTHVHKPPSSIPVKLNCQYFSLNQSGVAWEAIQRARNLAAYVPGDFPNPQLELIILLPETA